MPDPTSPRGSSARAGALAFTALSLVFAAGGAFLAYRLLSSGGYDREPNVSVVVAGVPIGAGHPLRPEDLRVIPWPASAVPQGAYASIDTLMKPQPGVPTSGFVAGEPILKERLAASDAGPGLAALVNKDSRAVAVQIDRAQAASKLLYPGAHVDVLVTLEDRAKNITFTRTVLEDVRVLAVGGYADIAAARRGQDPAKPTTESEAVVTLEVLPPDAEKLALSARQGKLDLALRNATDHDKAGAQGIALTELLQGPQPLQLAPPTSPVAVAAPGSSRRHGTTGPATPGAATTRTYPRQPGNDQKSSGSTIEVYSVPTQAR